MNYIESKSDIDIDWPLVRENIIQNQVVLHDSRVKKCFHKIVIQMWTPIVSW